jgi:glycosyltransferase involved in cell wall biosynthesis
VGFTGDKIKLLIIISSFPKPPNLMHLSPWALEQTKELAKLIKCTVVSPTPNLWMPKIFNRILPSKLKKWSNVESKHDFGDFIALYPRVSVRTYTRKARFGSSTVVADSWSKIVEKSVNVKDFDIILAHHPMVEGLIAKKLKEKYGIPFITIEHSHDDPFNGNDEYQQNYSEVASSADAFICPSKHVLESILSKYSVKNPMVIYNGGAQLIEGSKKFDFNDRIKFISVGALSEYKNHRTLIKAFDDPILREKAELEVIGDGPLRREYEELINSLKLQNVVRLSGNIPHNLVFNELDSSHVFVLISEENFSVAAVEAMSRGLPVVVSESTGIPELISDGIQGFVIKDDKRMDPKYVASVLKNFVSDPQIISEMSDAVLQTSRRLTWEENAKNFFHIIEDILGAKL